MVGRGVLGQAGDDLGVDEVSLSTETSNQQSDNVSSLAIRSLHFDAAITVVVRVDFRVSVEDAELASVKRMQLNSWVVNRIL